MSPDTLANATACGMLRAATYAGPMTTAMQKWGIDTPLRQAAFLGQVAHETGSLTIMQESMNYSAERMMQVWPKRFPTLESATPFAHNGVALGDKTYGGRMGNIHPGDGFNFRGAGCMQLTGREAFEGYAEASGVDVVSNPALVLQPEYACDSAAWEWHIKGCNALADARDWTAVTRKINGGTIGLANRITCTERAIKALGA